MRAPAALTLSIRVAVELATYGALGFWGASVSGPLPQQVALAVAFPLAAIALWGRFLSPRATRHLPEPAALLAELAIFSTAATGLAVTGHTAWALTLALAAGLDAAAIRILGLHRPGQPNGAPAA